METPKDYASNVFINCPFDDEFLPLFRAMVFAIIDCGFYARSALEIDDATEVRIEKIQRIIGDCKFGIHDISRTELDANHSLPRFNMPLELGIFLGSKRFGNQHQKDKRCLIMDREDYRYQKFISDIAGHDIKSHDDDRQKAISKVTEFLRQASGRTTVPGGQRINAHYEEFKEELPQILEESGLTQEEMGFNDFSLFASKWIILGT